MASSGVHIEGLKETIHALEELDSELPSKIRTALKGVAQDGADMAAFIAASKGDIYKGAGDHGDPSRHDGDLVQKISVRRAGPDAFAVVEYSRTKTKRYPGGYPYPRRLEYGDGGARSFMRPMAERMGPIANIELTAVIDRLIIEKGF